MEERECLLRQRRKEGVEETLEEEEEEEEKQGCCSQGRRMIKAVEKGKGFLEVPINKARQVSLLLLLGSSLLSSSPSSCVHFWNPFLNRWPLPVVVWVTHSVVRREDNRKQLKTENRKKETKKGDSASQHRSGFLLASLPSHPLSFFLRGRRRRRRRHCCTCSRQGKKIKSNYVSSENCIN